MGAAGATEFAGTIRLHFSTRDAGGEGEGRQSGGPFAADVCGVCGAAVAVPNLAVLEGEPGEPECLEQIGGALSWDEPGENLDCAAN